MKTAKQIKKEISSIIASYNPKTVNEKDKKKLDREAKFLRSCQYALERFSDEKILLKQLEQLKKLKENLDCGFSKWLQRGDVPLKSHTALKAMYRTEVGLRAIETQIKTLSYLIN